MKVLVRTILILAAGWLAAGCLLAGDGFSSKRDLSEVVLQQEDVPAEFSNLSVFGDEGIKMFFPLGEDDAIENYYGVSYLYPKDGLNYIYSIVVEFDDEDSAKSVYANVTGQVNSKIVRQENKFADESLVYSTLSETSHFSIWRHQATLGFVALVTRLVDAGFGYREVVAASKLVESRLSE